MVFELREVILAAVAAGLLGWLTRRTRIPANRDRLIARLLGAVLEPIYYWLDWKGADGRPSRSKVSYGLTLFVLLFGVAWFGMHLSHHSPDGKELGLNWPYIAYVIVVGLYSLGPQAFWVFMSTKLGPGLEQVLKARAGGVGGSTPASLPESK